MAITTHAELLTAIADYLASAGDSDLAAHDDDYVTLAEARIHFGAGEPGGPLYSPPLRVLAMEASADLTINGQSINAPTDFLAARRLYLNTAPIVALDFFVPQDFWARYVASEGGRPQAFTIEGATSSPYAKFVFGPAPDSSYTGKLLYWAKFSALSGGSNWLIANAPNVYLYGGLLEAAIHLEEEADMRRFHQLFAAALQGVMATDRMARHSGAPLVIRPPGPTP